MQWDGWDFSPAEIAEGKCARLRDWARGMPQMSMWSCYSGEQAARLERNFQRACRNHLEPFSWIVRPSETITVDLTDEKRDIFEITDALSQMKFAQRWMIDSLAKKRHDSPRINLSFRSSDDIMIFRMMFP